MSILLSHTVFGVFSVFLTAIVMFVRMWTWPKTAQESWPLRLTGRLSLATLVWGVALAFGTENRGPILPMFAPLLAMVFAATLMRAFPSLPDPRKPSVESALRNRRSFFWLALTGLIATSLAPTAIIHYSETGDPWALLVIVINFFGLLFGICVLANYFFKSYDRYTREYTAQSWVAQERFWVTVGVTAMAVCNLLPSALWLALGR